jgi:hypothetical protein
MFVEDGVGGRDLYNVDEKGIRQGGGQRIRNWKWITLVDESFDIVFRVSI